MSVCTSWILIHGFFHWQGYSRTRELDSEELLEHLPALQQLLYRLIGCRVSFWHLWIFRFCLILIITFFFRIWLYFVKFFTLTFYKHENDLMLKLQPEGAAIGNYVIQYALALVCWISLLIITCIVLADKDGSIYFRKIFSFSFEFFMNQLSSKMWTA